ncbi:MAG TPA: DUF3592 domain-containing protein, partial [Rhizobiales bacterium]|nr:DUF3592 domain-containing protein [Hyphomicrobiales bacterium]
FAVLAITAIVFLVVRQTGGGPWTPVNATVITTKIDRFRGSGPPQWALYADYEYRVSGRRYHQKALRVYSNPDRAAVSAEQKKWPPGRVFTVYYYPQDPRQTSLDRDGGRERLAIVVAVFTPFVLMIAAMIAIQIFRRKT